MWGPRAPHYLSIGHARQLHTQTRGQTSRPRADCHRMHAVLGMRTDAKNTDSCHSGQSVRTEPPHCTRRLSANARRTLEPDGSSPALKSADVMRRGPTAQMSIIFSSCAAKGRTQEGRGMVGGGGGGAREMVLVADLGRAAEVVHMEVNTTFGGTTPTLTEEDANTSRISTHHEYQHNTRITDEKHTLFQGPHFPIQAFSFAACPPQ